MTGSLSRPSLVERLATRSPDERRVWRAQDDPIGGIFNRRARVPVRVPLKPVAWKSVLAYGYLTAVIDRWGVPTEPLVNEAARRCLASSESHVEFEDALLGMSCALARHGLRVLVDPIHASVLGDERATRPLWRDLRREGTPEAVAAAVLHVLGLAVREIRRLPIGGLSPDGATVRVVGRQLIIPAQARPFLVWQRLRRLAETDNPAAPMFAVKERTASPRRLGGMISDVLAHAGYEIEPDSLLRRQPPHVEWLDQHGITIALA